MRGAVLPFVVLGIAVTSASLSSLLFIINYADSSKSLMNLAVGAERTTEEIQSLLKNPISCTATLNQVAANWDPAAPENDPDNVAFTETYIPSFKYSAGAITNMMQGKIYHRVFIESIYVEKHSVGINQLDPSSLSFNLAIEFSKRNYKKTVHIPILAQIDPAYNIISCYAAVSPKGVADSFCRNSLGLEMFTDTANANSYDCRLRDPFKLNFNNQNMDTLVDNLKDKAVAIRDSQVLNLKQRLCILADEDRYDPTYSDGANIDDFCCDIRPYCENAAYSNCTDVTCPP